MYSDNLASLVVFAPAALGDWGLMSVPESQARSAKGTGSRLTVVIPTYDRPDYLEDCLGSVVEQTAQGFRLVVLDNASPSDYADVLKRYSSSRIEYVRNPHNIGSVGNIAKAIKTFADNEFLTVFHDDDMMHPKMLQWQLEILEADPEIQFVATELTTFNDGEPTPGDVWEGLHPKVDVFQNPGELVRALLSGALLCFGSTMYRSQALQGVDFDADRFSIYADRPLLMDVARQGKCALIKAPLVSYRLHPGQDTSTGSLSSRNLVELLRCYRQALPADLSESDTGLFYAHARSFLLDSYIGLAAEQREGAFAFLRRCRVGGVLRWRDLKLGDYATLMRVDGWGRHVDAALAVRRRLFRR